MTRRLASWPPRRRTPHAHRDWFYALHLDSAPRPRFFVDLLFEPRDLWVGVYWDRPKNDWDHALDVYVTLLPMLPIKVMIRMTGAKVWFGAARKAVRLRLRYGYWEDE